MLYPFPVHHVEVILLHNQHPAVQLVCWLTLSQHPQQRPVVRHCCEMCAQEVDAEVAQAIHQAQQLPFPWLIVGLMAVEAAAGACYQVFLAIIIQLAQDGTNALL
jgi:hypothetical protein